MKQARWKPRCSATKTLDQWMVERGIGNAEVAEKLGLTVSSVSRIRRGKQIPSLGRMAKIIDLTSGEVQLNAFIQNEVG